MNGKDFQSSGAEEAWGLGSELPAGRLAQAGTVSEASPGRSSWASTGGRERELRAFDESSPMATGTTVLCLDLAQLSGVEEAQVGFG